MNKLENEKCIKLMEEAISYGRRAKLEFDKINKLEGIEKDIAELNGQNSLGYAEGINQVLVTLGFKHNRMKELSRLI